MLEKNKNIKETNAELRKFGITIAVALAVIGAIMLWRQKAYYYCPLVVAAILLLPALAMPIILKPVHKIWMAAAEALGWFMTRVILTLLFYLVVTPIALIARLAGKDFLNRKFQTTAKSYWIPKKKSELGKTTYEKQF